MGLLPETDLGLLDFETDTQPGLTYALDMAQGRVRGKVDDREAMAQAIYLILHVERYAYPIYSWNYGAELADLIGKPKDYAMSEAKRRITEALLQDDRILAVDGWAFEEGKKSVRVSFVAHTVYGDVEAETEVEI
ncbi:MAG: DUF2634 domain-containing protein [Oscillospiraceae bacterium]|jgi:hypothetical protein|nr:DUF2634 domain-containing protein [Oscillospiraceae bacterium]